MSKKSSLKKFMDEAAKEIEGWPEFRRTNFGLLDSERQTKNPYDCSKKICSGKKCQCQCQIKKRKKGPYDCGG